MDPLSITASITAILQLTSKAIKYLVDVKDAPKECHSCRAGLLGLLQPLISLKDQAERAQSELWFEQLRKLNVRDGTFDQYKQALELLLSKVVAGKGMGKVKKRLLWKFTKEQVASIQGTIERLQHLITIALTMDHMTLSVAIKADISTVRAAILSVQADVSNTQTTIYSVQNDVKNIRDTHTQEKYRAVLQWLSTTDYPAQQQDILLRRQESTAQWFLDSTEFNQWVQGSNRTLFCPGIPGAGKTMMAAVAIDHLTRTYSDDSVGIAYIFCDYKRQAEQTLGNNLAAMAKQLIRSRPDMIERAAILQKNHSKFESKASVDELVALLMSACASFSVVYVVVDALDECSPNDEGRNRLIDVLRTLQNETGMHLLFTSRHINKVTDRFKSDPLLEVRASNEDVRRFVDGKVETMPECVQDNEGLQVEVRNKITEAADGMFLLAKLHVDSLQDKTSARKVRAAVATLKKGSEALEKAYEDALARIDLQLNGHRSLAKRALLWISYAKRPLSVNELRIALAIEPGDQTLESEDLTPLGTIVSSCTGLITVDNESSIVRLVHYTTQEFLERVRSEWAPEMQAEIARTCLTYLSFEEFKKGSCTSDTAFKTRLAEFEFLGYSAKFWSEHFRPVEDSALDLALSVVCHDALLESITQAAIFSGYESTNFSQYFPRQSTPLHLSARCGLLQLTMQLLVDNSRESKKDIDARDDGGKSPLYYASSHGYEQVVRLLLDKGADVNAVAGYYGTALQAASLEGHEQVARLLLGKGANINAVAGYYSTALQAASLRGREQVVRLLLGKGADVNAVAGYHGTALQAASYGGHEQVVRLLLDKGADVNAEGGEFGNALQAASKGGHEHVVRLLLGKGANVNAKGGEFGNALQAASFKGQEQVVRLLLDKGADVNAKGGEFDNALQAASKGGHEQVVMLLLLKGAKVYAKGGEFGNALRVASLRGQEQVVRLLLDKGADVNAKGGEFGNALQAASLRGQEQVVRLLLDKGADVNAVAGYCGTALQAASLRGQEQVVRLLLEKGADVNAEGGKFGNALQAASLRGQEQVVRLLLGKGADVNAEGGKFCNALQAASLRGQEQVVRLLLGKGADVNAEGGEFGNALQAASYGGHKQVVRLLLEENKADVNIRGGKYGTALQAASKKNHEQIVKLLLE